jgi:hypothetical protein
VQNGEHHIQADRLVSSLVQNDQSVHRPVRGKHRETAVAVVQIGVRAVTEPPFTVLRDTDVVRLVLFRVEVLGNLLRGFDGDGMLLGAATEDDADLQLIHADSCFRISGN